MEMEINKQYENMYLQISLDNEQYTDKEMKAVYREQKKAMSNMLNIVGKLYVKYSVEGKLKLSAAEKAKVRKELISKLKIMGNYLSVDEVDKVNKILKDVTNDSYNKTAYVMDFGMRTELSFPLIRNEFISAVLKADFKGENFSDRIWNNKDKLIKRLRVELEDAMKGNKTVDQVAKGIKDQFSVTAYESQRLARTEMCRVQVSAQNEIALNTGVKKQLFLATLDNKTSDICRSLDGKVFNFDDPNKPVLPLHPHERSLLINIPNDEWSPKKRRDNESKEIIDYKDYNNWLNDRGIE